MTTALNEWVRRATQNLSKDARETVRIEIEDHFQSGREAALAAGRNDEAAQQLALEALGNPAEANCSYRRTMITAAESRMLRESSWEARYVCSHPWAKYVMAIAPGVALGAAQLAYFTGKVDLARTLLVVGAALAIVFAGPLLPIYTPRRSRIYRALKLAVLLLGPWLILGGDYRRNAAWLAPCLWPVLWIEWTRWSLRRKLPAPRWPKQLYL